MCIRDSLYNGMINPNAIRGSIASIALDFGISIIPTRNAQDLSLIHIYAKLDISKSNFTNNIKNYVNGDRLVGAVTTIGNATISDS